MRSAKPIVRWTAVLALTVIVFYWKVLFTSQFSLLLYKDPATQYTWIHHAAASLQRGVVPLWDPYSQSGRSFVGESQTGLFYPPKLLLYLAPFTDRGVLSPELYHAFHVLSHILGGWFMLLLARELGVSWFGSYVSALCFALAGAVGKVTWPDYLDSAIWLPLVILCLIRALGRGGRRRFLHAACAGAALGMTILGGRIHVTIMDALVVASACLFAALPPPGTKPAASRLASSAAVAAVVFAVAAASGAVQLLPSVEYGRLALRYIKDGPIDAFQKIPFDRLEPGLEPRGVLELVTGFPIRGSGEESPYLGMLPFVLAILGVATSWRLPWVRYLALLALLSLYASLGVYSLLYGLLYATIPYAWFVREPERFLYVTHFALALLAGVGVQALLQEGFAAQLRSARRVLGWFTLAFAAVLWGSALFRLGQPSEWHYFALLVAAASCGALWLLQRRGDAPWTRFALAAVILCDLSGFHWSIRNKAELQRQGEDHLADLFRFRGAAGFLKSQPGLFRVHLDDPETPNVGDLYGIQTTNGYAATELKSYGRFRASHTKSQQDLLNVRYVVRRKELEGATPVYQDAYWKVYDRPGYYPRAWLASHTAVEPSPDAMPERLARADFDSTRLALVERPIELPAVAEDARGEVTVDRYVAHRIELTSRTDAARLLVLSEVFYPGWSATVNGTAAEILRVQGLLRGVVVPAGESRVVFVYAPWTVAAGGALSASTFAGVFAAWLAGRRRRRAAGAPPDPNPMPR